MTAVIYARYSSDNQREESIEGQIRECTAYAEKNGITVIKHYIDRAFSAKTDNRPEFQQMIKDSYYYKCANVKRRRGCNKKTVQKDWLEDLVVRETMKLIQDDAVIDKIVQLVMDVQNQENTTIPLLEKQLREVNKKLDNLMKAIEDGLYTRTTKERLEALESQKDELTVKIADEKLKKPSFNEDFIRFWLMKFRKFDISQKKQRKALIEIFVNAIFLYDDRMLLTFNYKDGTQTVRFEDTLTADCGEKRLRLRSNESPSGAFEQQNGLAQARWRGRAPTNLDLSSSAGPKIQRFQVRNRWIFLLIGWSHLVLTTILTTMPTILSGQSQG